MPRSTYYYQPRPESAENLRLLRRLDELYMDCPFFGSRRMAVTLEAAFRFGQPEIWNSDQGAQFTSADFLAPLKQRGVSISMDGRGRALDNVFIERLWRSLKYELIYPGDFSNGADLLQALHRYFHFYNHQRPHQALGYRMPADLFPRRSNRKRSPP